MKYYCVRQRSSSDCGPAAIATVLKQYGYSLSVDNIREKTGTDKQGTSLYGMLRATEQIGFNTKVVRKTNNALLHKCALPCIAHVTNKHNGAHYVVIHKIKKNKMIIADPNQGIIKITLQDFLGETKSPSFNYRWSGILILITPEVKLDAATESKNTFLKFFYLIKPHKQLMIHIFIASILYTILGIIGAFYYQMLIDDILPNTLVNTLTTITVGVILLNLFKVVLEAIRNHLLLYLSQKLDVSLLFGYYNHVIRLPMDFFNSRKTGEVVSRFYDASKVREAISGATLTILIDALMVTAGAIMLFLQNKYLFGIAVIMVVLYGIIVLTFDNKYKKYNQEVMENDAQLNSYFIEVLNGMQTVKSSNATEKVNWNSENKFIKFLKSIFNLNWFRNLQNTMKIFVELIGGIVILWVGAVNVLNQTMTIGELITFTSLLVYFLEPIKNLINLQPQIKTAVVAAERLEEILELDEETDENEYKKIIPEKLTGDIEFQNVSFRYGSRKLVLEDINIKIDPGKNVAFVGESGSGKSTLLKLILRLYKPEEGKLLVDGFDVEDIQVEALRDKISYVSQETFLFSGTIFENLTLGADDCRMEDVIKIAKLTKVHDFVNEMPARYDTKIEENGTNFSGGQRQRLAIARSLIKKPNILLMDEATSHLDSVTEQEITQIINEYCKDMTMIFVAHRLSTIKNCDTIYVLSEGKIVESGTHHELIKAKGRYYDLVKRQSLESRVVT